MTTRVILAAIVIAFAFALIATPASAKHRSHRMTFQFAVMVAADYWAKRDIAIPCHPQQRLFSWRETREIQRQYIEAGVTDAYGQVDMLAYVDVCTVGIMPEADALRYARDTAFVYCREVVHEIGHLAGLEHDYGEIMDPSWSSAPWGCTHPIKFRRLQTKRH